MERRRPEEAGAIGHSLAMATVSLRQLRKAFGTHAVVHGVDLDIADREFVVLVGPSGCGKSTILRMIAGLEDITGGEICIGERARQRARAQGPRHRHGLPGLRALPAYDRLENMAFGLRYRGGTRSPRSIAASRRPPRILGLEQLLAARPAAAVGRPAPARRHGPRDRARPQVFLFDEPLSNLDAKLRVQMRTEIKRLHERVSTTMIYVTHDQVEAMTLADRIVMLDARPHRAGRHARGGLQSRRPRPSSRASSARRP